MSLNPFISRSVSEPGPGRITGVVPTRAISTGTQLTPEEINQKISQFDTDLDKYLSERNFITVDNDVLEIKSDNNNKEMLVRYKIGRFNPPHKGHIELFMRNIREMEQAKKANPNLVTKVIIFAGNGAKNEPKIKNPLDFNTKKDVIKYLLQKEMPGVNIDDIVEIREKDYKDERGESVTPITQLTGFVSSELENKPRLSNVTTQLAVGDKDDDASKLDFMNKALNKYLQDKSFQDKYPDLKFTSEIVPMSAVTLAPGGGGAAIQQQQSATLIRQIASETASPEIFRQEVIGRTGLDYGIKAETVWNSVQNANKEAITNPNTSSNKRRKILGGTRRSKKTYRTNKRNINRNKKSTKRSKRNRRTNKRKNY